MCVGVWHMHTCEFRYTGLCMLTDKTRLADLLHHSSHTPLKHCLSLNLTLAFSWLGQKLASRWSSCPFPSETCVTRAGRVRGLLCESSDLNSGHCDCLESTIYLLSHLSSLTRPSLFCRESDSPLGLSIHYRKHKMKRFFFIRCYAHG